MGTSQRGSAAGLLVVLLTAAACGRLGYEPLTRAEAGAPVLPGADAGPDTIPPRPDALGDTTPPDRADATEDGQGDAPVDQDVGRDASDGSPPEAPSDDASPDVAPEDAASTEDTGNPADASPLANGLIGHWRFDERAGTVAADSSGRGNHGTVLGTDPAAGWATGRVGGALDCGAVRWVRVPSSDDLNAVSRAITIAGWVYRRTQQTGFVAVVTRQSELTAGHWFLGYREDMRLIWAGILPHNPVPAPPTGRWVHLAGTYDGATRRLYVDGNEVDRTDTVRRFDPDTTPMFICAGANGPDPEIVDERLDALIDEVMLYTRALSATEVRALAAGTVP